MRKLFLSAAFACALASAAAEADEETGMSNMPGMENPSPAAQHPTDDKKGASGNQQPEAATESGGMSGMEGMSGIDGTQNMGGMSMSSTGVLGAYPASRDASGTSWQPDAADPMHGLHAMRGGWMLMGHMTLFGVYDTQSGPRGDDKFFPAGMLMGMARRDLATGDVLNFRAMLSPDPFMGKSGYPLLLATGETANGVTPLVDRQHPHDLFMELSGSYSHKLTGEDSVFIYAG